MGQVLFHQVVDECGAGRDRQREPGKACCRDADQQFLRRVKRSKQAVDRGDVCRAQPALLKERIDGNDSAAAEQSVGEQSQQDVRAYLPGDWSFGAGSRGVAGE